MESLPVYEPAPTDTNNYLQGTSLRLQDWLRNPSTKEHVVSTNPLTVIEYEVLSQVAQRFIGRPKRALTNRTARLDLRLYNTSKTRLSSEDESLYEDK